MHNQGLNKESSVKAAYSSKTAMTGEEVLKHPMVQKGLAGAALGGLAGGAIGYAQDPDADVKHKTRARLLSALGHGVSNAVSGGALGLQIGAHQLAGGATTLQDALHDPYFQRLVGGSAAGAALGGALGYGAGAPENYLDRKSRRGQMAAANALPVAAMFGSYASAGSNRANRASYYGGSGRDYDSPPPMPGDDENVSDYAGRFDHLYDVAHHGKPMKYVFNTILKSREVTNPMVREPLMNFMKFVGRPGANVEQLKAWMDAVPGDTAARQLMNVLFNKHHGDYKPRLKLASYVETCLSFGIYTPFQTATW